MSAKASLIRRIDVGTAKTGTKPNPKYHHEYHPLSLVRHRSRGSPRYYTSIIRNSKITDISHYSDSGTEIHGQKAGSVLMVSFELDGRPFSALNGGPVFKFTKPSRSRSCATPRRNSTNTGTSSARAAIPSASRCGWLKDKYGLSWQLVPSIVPELLRGPVTEKTSRLMAAVMGMKKIDIATLKRAWEG